jgi:hypothetical protein
MAQRTASRLFTVGGGPNPDEISDATITADRGACSRVVRRTSPPAHSKTQGLVGRAISMSARTELPHPSGSLYSHNTRALLGRFPLRSSSVVERPGDSGPRIVAPAHRQSAPACSHSAHASPWPGSAPTRPECGVFGPGIERSIVRLRRPPADMSVKWEKEAAPNEDPRNRYRRILQTP